MKFFSIVLSLFFSFSIYAQSDCRGYFPFEEGTIYELTSYDKKDKVSSVTTYEIDFVGEGDEGVEAQVQTEIKDKKGEVLSDGHFLVYCTENGYTMDVTAMMNQEMLANYEGMEMEITGDGLNFPHDMKVGQELPDGVTEISVSTGPIGAINMTFQVTDRKVEAKETITTPAGTFECLKITQTTTSEIMIGSRDYQTIEWYAEGVGMVKSETYSSKGKLQSWTQLTSFSKG